MGQTEFDGIAFDLNAIIDLVPLPEHDHPFSAEKITAVIKDLPNDHAPRMDSMAFSLKNVGIL